MRFISIDIIIYLIHGGRNQFADGIFKFIFGNGNVLCFYWNFTEYVPRAQLTIIRLNNGLQEKKRQPIVWIKVGLDWWHMCVTQSRWVNTSLPHFSYKTPINRRIFIVLSWFRAFNNASCCGIGGHNATDYHAVAFIGRPFHWYRNSNSMEISFCSPSSNEMVVKKFCTWHDSCALLMWRTV